MEFVKQFVILVDALVWPAVAAWIAYQFRSEIRALINRVVNDSEEVSMFGVSAKFGDAKRNLSRLDVPDEEKIKISSVIDDSALSQIKELSKNFYSKAQTQRNIAAKEVAEVGLDIDLNLLIELANSSSAGERVAAAIALRKHIERDYSVLENSDLNDVIKHGLEDNRSRVRYRFVELVVGNSMLSQQLVSILKTMAANDDNEAIRTKITRSLGYY